MMRSFSCWIKKFSFLTLLAVFISACTSSGSNSKDELKPAELEKITQEVKLKVQWSRSIGDGQGKIWNRLKPAVDDNTIYAADSDGKVFAFNRESGEPGRKK